MSYKANYLNISQHPQQLVTQGQPLLGAQALHAIQRQVHMVGQALRFVPPRVLGSLRTTIAIERVGGAIERGRRLVGRTSGIGWPSR